MITDQRRAAIHARKAARTAIYRIIYGPADTSIGGKTVMHEPVEWQQRKRPSYATSSEYASVRQHLYVLLPDAAFNEERQKRLLEAFERMKPKSAEAFAAEAA